MKNELASGLGQQDLTIQYTHNEVGQGFNKKDVQVIVGEILGTFMLVFLVGSSKITPNNSESDANMYANCLHWMTEFVLRLWNLGGWPGSSGHYIRNGTHLWSPAKPRGNPWTVAAEESESCGGTLQRPR